MDAFAQLLDRLSLEPRRLGKEALLVRYFSETPDPDRGFALAALTGALDFKNAKPALLRELIGKRVDAHLFALSYDFVGDLSETVALMWPETKQLEKNLSEKPILSEVILRLTSAQKADVPALLESWLDMLNEVERWALLKLVTGGLRVGVSARLAKHAVAKFGNLDLTEIEEVWHGLSPPYEQLFSWAEGRTEAPINKDPVPFRPVMLAHPLDTEKDLEKQEAKDFAVEWKWDGIRVQAASAQTSDGSLRCRLYSRTGEDISKAFPDIVTSLDFDACIDGELLIVENGIVRPFSELQKRLNRKTAGPKLCKDHPAAIRVYDILSLKGEDLRSLAFYDRRKKLEHFIENLNNPRIDLSPLVDVDTWQSISQARAEPSKFLPQANAEAVEGLMLKRWDSEYTAGRPKGLWFKWKKDPYLIDAVLMYAQRGHGKRSSYYSDYTFGVWRQTEHEPVLVPVGKAYFGFTDAELAEIDRFVRANTINRFGPVREVKHDAENGLVFEVAFEGINRSKRHKSGVAMRFSRISRLRWDKPASEADCLDVLENMLSSREQ